MKKKTEKIIKILFAIAYILLIGYGIIGILIKAGVIK
jgi:hypothetical protein